MIDLTRRNCMEQFWLTDENSGKKIPVTVLHGNLTGKTGLITAGLHNCEYVGVAATTILANTLKLEQIHGTVILAHSCDYSGFLAHGNDKTLEDGEDVNNFFPGDESGTATQKLAAFIRKELLEISDFVVDLHSGGFNESLVPHCYYQAASSEASQVSFQMAQCTDIRCAVQVSTRRGLYSWCPTVGIPAILLERGESGLIHPGEPEAAAEDVKNILRYMGCLADGVPQKRYDVPAISKAYYLEADVDGCWFPVYKPGVQFEKGVLLGEIRDIFGNLLQSVWAEEPGLVLYQTESLAIAKGEITVAYAAWQDA